MVFNKCFSSESVVSYKCINSWLVYQCIRSVLRCVDILSELCQQCVCSLSVVCLYFIIRMSVTDMENVKISTQAGFFKPKFDPKARKFQTKKE